MALAKKTKSAKNYSPTVLNRAARHRYELLETFECGIELYGTEIKSVRQGNMNIRDGFARVKNGELFLHNVHISPWTKATAFFNHDPVRERRLLLHKKSIRKLEGKQKDKGLTLIPTKTYFSDSGYLKVEVALARGKQLHDKREDLKRRDDKRNMQRIIKATVAG